MNGFPIDFRRHAGHGALRDLVRHGTLGEVSTMRLELTGDAAQRPCDALDLAEWVLDSPMCPVLTLDGGYFVGRTESGVKVCVHANAGESDGSRIEICGSAATALARETLDLPSGGRVHVVDGRRGLDRAIAFDDVRQLG